MSAPMRARASSTTMETVGWISFTPIATATARWDRTHIATPRRDGFRCRPGRSRWRSLPMGKETLVGVSSTLTVTAKSIWFSPMLHWGALMPVPTSTARARVARLGSRLPVTRRSCRPRAKARPTTAIASSILMVTVCPTSSPTTMARGSMSAVAHLIRGRVGPSRAR